MFPSVTNTLYCLENIAKINLNWNGTLDFSVLMKINTLLGTMKFANLSYENASLALVKHHQSSPGASRH